MTYDEIINKNPWRKISLGQLYESTEEYLLAEDTSLAKDFNVRMIQANDKKNKLVLNIPPEPWQGNPLKAKVIFLSLNPGYVDNVNHKLAKVLQEDRSLLERMMAFKRSTLNLTSNSFMPETNNEEPIGTKDAISMLGDWYWENGFRNLRDYVCNGTYSEEQFYRDVAIMQYHAYSSEKYEKAFPPKGCSLESQKFTRELIQYISDENPNTVFVIMRATKKWKEFLGEDLYKKLNKIEKESKSMSQAISPKNLGEDNFAKIVNALKNRWK